MTMLPTVDSRGLNATRMIIGANPFAGFSHQNPERDEEIVAYYTTDRIKETWQRAEAPPTRWRPPCHGSDKGPQPVLS